MPRMMRNPRMTILCLALLLLSSSACTMWAERKTKTWSNVTSGEHLSRLFWQEVKAKNWQELHDRMAATVLAMNGQGTFDRDGILAHLKTIDISDFQIGEVQTQPAGADLVVTYTLSVKGTRDGKPLPSTLRMMSVWQQLKGGWILIAHTAIPVSES